MYAHDVAVRDKRVLRQGAPASGSGSSAAESMLGLQRSAGNAATAQLVQALREGGLPADEGTQRMPGSLLTVGSHDDDVANVQQQLNDQGAHLVVDGRFGAGTAAAVRSFQQQAGLAADGIVGPATRHALQTGHGPTAGDQETFSRRVEHAIEQQGAGSGGAAGGGAGGAGGGTSGHGTVDLPGGGQASGSYEDGRASGSVATSRGSATGSYDTETGAASGAVSTSQGQASGSYDPTTGSGAVSVAGSSGSASGSYDGDSGRATASGNYGGNTATGAYDANTGSGTGAVVTSGGAHASGSWDAGSQQAQGTYSSGNTSAAGVVNVDQGTGSGNISTSYGSGTLQVSDDSVHATVSVPGAGNIDVTVERPDWM